ncbi:MAG: hypothetical protein OEY31_13565, partial [Candidatus Bathyarchaeota archaeon]|nr:hypothetical protein [Candidatus Bathyarchaeota archaeon]
MFGTRAPTAFSMMIAYAILRDGWVIEKINISEANITALLATRDLFSDASSKMKLERREASPYANR